jgi:hypothetical protein
MTDATSPSASTGQARAAWRAEPGPGSLFHGISGDNLVWAAGDRLVFPWERSGWVHLYAVPAAGGSATELTPGAGEVQYVAASGDRRELVYSSNQGDIDRQHLWRVAVQDNGPGALTHTPVCNIIVL